MRSHKRAKRLLHILVFAAILALISLSVGIVCADEEYTIVTGGSSKTNAPSLDMNTMYATSLTGNETIYLKFTTPAQKGFFDYYCMNINVPTHSWSADSQVRFDLIDAVDEKKCSIKLGYGGKGSENLSLLPATTYYICIKNYCYLEDQSVSGNVKVKLTYTEDQVKDTMSEAAPIRLAQDVVSSFDGKEDVDYFKFTTGSLENYKLSMKNIDVPTHTWSNSSMFSVQIRSAISEIIKDLRASMGREASADVALLPNTTYYVYVANPTWGGVGNYTFSIDPITTPLDDASINYTESYTYTGKAIKPKVKVTIENVLLKEKVDYKVKYSKNVQPGYGKIKITGMGKYSGEKTVEFTISPKKETISLLKSSSAKKLKVKIKKDSSVTGYEISYATNSKFSDEKIVKFKTNSKTLSVKAKEKYYVRVRGYVKVGSKVIYGKWSKTKTVKTK